VRGSPIKGDLVQKWSRGESNAVKNASADSASGCDAQLVTQESHHQLTEIVAVWPDLPQSVRDAVYTLIRHSQAGRDNP
jgi:hypothetical protein